MNLKEYMDLASKTASELGSKDLDSYHFLMGMITEVGELVDAYKKNLAYGKELDLVNIQEELGDLMWYIINFCRINDFDLESILDVNIDKLKKRYGDKFSSEKAINRRVDEERILLELGFGS